MPEGSRQYILQLRIGAFVLLALGVFLGIIVLLGSQSRLFERKYDLHAEFTEVGGLIEGATVRLAGVQVGRVTGVVLPPEVGGKVRVTLRVARRFSDRIRADSEARIATQGLLGDKLVEITLGTSSAPAAAPGHVLDSREPLEVTRVVAEGSEALASVTQLAQTLRVALERLETTGALDDVRATLKSARRLTGRLESLERSQTFGDIAAAARSARRITEEVERGRGWLHTLIYEEPDALRRLNALLSSTQELVTKAEKGDTAVSVLLSPESGRATRSLLRAMETVARGAEKVTEAEGLLGTLLYDPRYKPVAEDLRSVARNFRDVSERLARGEGILGGLLQQPPGKGPMGEAAADFRVAMANLRAITDRLKAGEGTIGALLEDPTVYENLAEFLEGAQRSFLLRSLIRSTIGDGGKPGGPGGARGTGERK